MAKESVLNLCNNNVKERKSDARIGGCRLYGIEQFYCPSNTVSEEKNLAGHATISCAVTEDPPVQAIVSIDEWGSPSELSKFPKEPKQVPQVSPKEIQSKHNYSARSRTKVHMHGMAVGRAIDLTVFDGYNELFVELEPMFDLKGELRDCSKWEVAFTDDEDGMMLLGDDPAGILWNGEEEIHLQ